MKGIEGPEPFEQPPSPFEPAEPRLYHATDALNERRILASFTPEEAEEIRKKQALLSSLAYFVGKDFNIPVLLNEPGGGWYWDQERNHIKIDPIDLLEKPLDYLRFVICHEAGHRRISRIIGVIPKEVWKQPGFAFMSNALEDPRDNNFVAEAYPRFREQMLFAYDLKEKEMLERQEAEASGKAKKRLGFQPKFMKAGFEYLRQWVKEANDKPFEIDPTLPEDVRAVVEATLPAAQDSWWRYPSKEEADASEETVEKYAAAAYKIWYEQVWPEFKKLVENDIEKQKEQEALRKNLLRKKKEGKQSQEGDGEGQGKEENAETSLIPPELKEKLSPAEQKELEEALEKALGGSSKEEVETSAEEEEETSEEDTPVVDLESLSEELQKKIAEYINELPDEVKEELYRRALEAITQFEQEIADQLEGKLVDTPVETADDAPPTPIEKPKTKESENPIDKSDLRKAIEAALHGNESAYEQARSETIDIINQLENELREIFVARRAHRWETGFKSGKRIDIKRRIQEKAKGVSVPESRSWERRELPEEKDYVFTLLMDLSGSMLTGNKIKETFKAAVVISEALNRLSIRTEILGFNAELHIYKDFAEDLSQIVREVMGHTLEEVRSQRAGHNDDGWAIQEASARLEKQKATEKILIVLSDGQPAPSFRHNGPEYELKATVARIVQKTNQRIIGLGVGPYTDHVRQYYPQHIAGVDVKAMAQTLAQVVKDTIANPTGSAKIDT
jgi:cobalamin biosynthesis protein CobT